MANSAENTKRRPPGKPVWTWRDAIRQTPVPPLTKLVCWALANYITDLGEGCFPGVDALMADTGLSNRSIATHLQHAVDAGLLVVERQKFDDGRYRRTLYLPRFPDEVDLPRVPRSAPCEPASHGDETVNEPGSAHVNLAHMDDEPCEGGSRGPCEPGASVHVKEVHAHKEESNLELSKISPQPPSRAGRGARGRAAFENGIGQVLAAIRTPDRARALDGLLGPLARCRKIEAPDVGFALGQLADWAKLQDLDDQGLAAVLERIRAERDQTVRAVDVEKAVRAEAPLSEGRRRAAAALAEQGRICEPAVAGAWNEARQTLGRMLGQPVVDAWLAEIVAVGIDAWGTVTLAAPNTLKARHVETNWGHHIERLMGSMLPGVRSVRVVAHAQISTGAAA